VLGDKSLEVIDTAKYVFLSLTLSLSLSFSGGNEGGSLSTIACAGNRWRRLVFLVVLCSCGCVGG
jgi:hypothetical protein